MHVRRISSLAPMVSALMFLASQAGAQTPSLVLEAKNGALLFKTPDLEFQGQRPSVELLLGQESVTLTAPEECQESTAQRSTPMGSARERTWSWRDPRGFGVSCTLSRLAPWRGATLRMTFTNASSQSVRLRKFALCHTDSQALRAAGNPADWFLSTVDSHDAASGGFNPSGDLATAASRKFLDTLTLYTQRGERGMVIGAVGPAESDVRFRTQILNGRASLEIDSEMNDILVDPGETRRSEEVLLLAEPYETAVTQLFRWMATTHGARTQRGAVYGWCSWYNQYANITEQSMDATLQALIKERSRLPMEVFQLDDGWQKCYGDWTINPAKFPSGMKAMADKITTAGMIPGVWMTMVTSSKEGVHPDGNPADHLDPTFPGTREYIQKTLKTRYAEGFRYFKLDFNNPRWKDRYNQKVTRLQLMRDLFKLYRESIGEDSYMCACVGGINRGAIGYADSLRIGTDSGPRDLPMYTGCAMPDLFNAIGSTALTHGILFANDPDVVFTIPEKYHRMSLRGQKIELPNLPNAVRAWNAYAGLLGGTLMTSDCFEKAPWNNDTAIRMMEIMYPSAPEKARAFDGQTDPWHRQFGLTVSRPWGQFVSAMVYNPKPEKDDLPIKGIPVGALGERFHIWSFWDEKYMGISDTSFMAREIAPTGGILLRLTKQGETKDQPVLIGSTLHISMGAAEIASIGQQGDVLRIALSDAGARAGTLYFHSPKALTLISAQGCEVPAVESAGEGVWKVKLLGRQRGKAQSIELRVGS